MFFIRYVFPQPVGPETVIVNGCSNLSVMVSGVVVFVAVDRGGITVDDVTIEVITLCGEVVTTLVVNGVVVAVVTIVEVYGAIVDRVEDVGS
jgi:hypothetical protein